MCTRKGPKTGWCDQHVRRLAYEPRGRSAKYVATKIDSRYERYSAIKTVVVWYVRGEGRSRYAKPTKTSFCLTNRASIGGDRETSRKFVARLAKMEVVRLGFGVSHKCEILY